MNDEGHILVELYERRVLAGITQTEVARKMGTAQSMVSRLERGVVAMSVLQLLRYCEAIGEAPDEVLRAAHVTWKGLHSEHAQP